MFINMAGLQGVEAHASLAMVMSAFNPCRLGPEVDGSLWAQVTKQIQKKKKSVSVVEFGGGFHSSKSIFVSILSRDSDIKRTVLAVSLLSSRKKSGREWHGKSKVSRVPTAQIGRVVKSRHDVLVYGDHLSRIVFWAPPGQGHLKFHLLSVIFHLCFQRWMLNTLYFSIFDVPISVSLGFCCAKMKNRSNLGKKGFAVSYIFRYKLIS